MIADKKLDAQPQIGKPLDEKIGAALVGRGILEQADVDKVLTRQQAGDTRLFGEIAVDIGVLTVRELIDFLREE
jgi:hypothetical protein